MKKFNNQRFQNSAFANPKKRYPIPENSTAMTFDYFDTFRDVTDQMANHATQFFRLDSLDKIINNFKELDYFDPAKSAINTGKFWPESNTERFRLKQIIDYVENPETGKNIGLRGRLFAIIALLGPFGMSTPRISDVINWILESSSGSGLEQSRKDTLRRLLSTKPENSLTSQRSEGSTDKLDPISYCPELIKNSQCIFDTVTMVSEKLADSPSSTISITKWTSKKRREALLDVLFLEAEANAKETSRTPRAFSNPLDLFLELARKLQLEVPNDSKDATEDPHLVSGVQLGLEQYASKGENSEKSTDVQKAIRTIKQALCHCDIEETSAQQNSHLVLLWGSEQTGKKSAVGDLLRELRRDLPNDERFGLDLRDSDTHEVKHVLPVFAVVVQRIGYRDLLVNLFCFLSMRQPGVELSAKKLRDEALGMLKNKPSGLSLVERIAALHQVVPTFFIFCDVHGFARDGFNIGRYERGIFDLLSALTEKPSLSRFLITQEHAGFDDWHVEPAALTHQNFEMEIPKLARFPWYPSEAVYQRYQRPAFSDLRNEAQRQILAKSDADNLTGNGLLSMSAYLALEEDDDKAASALANYAQVVGRGYDGENERMRRARLNRKLLQRFNTEKIDDVILLLAATALTQDGLSEVTLKRMLCNWRGCSLAELSPQWKKIERSLEQLSNGTQELYISLKRDAPADPEEFYRTEVSKKKSDRPKKITEWRMSRAAAFDLVTDIRDMKEFDHLIRCAFRQVAREAHRRSQIKRLRQRGSEWENVDPKRDIQSFRALLASLPSKISPVHKFAPFGNLRKRLELVFDANPDKDPGMTLRYAIMVLLRRDIDPNHMLSIVTDQDELRLNLYLRIFKPLGSIEDFSVSELRAKQARSILPKKVNSHLHAVLSVREILDVLLSIMVAAYHSQLEEVVHWAYGLAAGLLTSHSAELEVEDHSIFSHILCILFDASIQQGTILAPSKRNGPPKPLQELRTEIVDACQQWRSHYQISDGDQEQAALLNALFCYIDGRDIDSTATEIQGNLTFEMVSPQKSERALKDGMRLMARFAEVDWMTKPVTLESQRGLIGFYRNLAKLEDVIAKHHGDTSEPIVMSGRSGRRLIRALTQDNMIFSYPDTTVHPAPPKVLEIDELVRSVLHANAQRQGQFAGADRLATLVDFARLRGTDTGDLRAQDVLTDCAEALEDSLISVVGRLEIEMLMVGTYLNQASKHLKDTGSPGDLETLTEHCAKLERMTLQAKERALYPTEIALLLLKARASHIMAHHPDSPVDLGQSRKEFRACFEMADAHQFMPAASCALAWLTVLGKG